MVPLAPSTRFCIDTINFSTQVVSPILSKNLNCYSWGWETFKIWNKSVMACVSNFPCLFFSPQPRPFSPPIHSSSPPPIAPLARAESTSSISSTNSLSAATTPTVGKNYLLSFHPFVVLTGYFYDLETPEAQFLVKIVLLCVLLLSSDSSFKSTFSAKQAKCFKSK